ncbi:uncharacterized protein LY79DRAFT_671637 [Colletotrichum navitas]|uniref:Uncharacterized protein n=1 Tax=Colletotrichum navitas TaxID=681940 RepID=A0AAD8PU31_9PEZI|nr:uncharacterized protein LY79DRAFT_671637 [Colletotrichum navitas]KAK1580759.1 hypothetical protein LY79DRAFT_671637 [Colletotrichum navitas]
MTQADIPSREGVGLSLLFKAVKDWEQWPLYLIGLTAYIPPSPPSTYLSYILRQLGFSTFQANLLAIPSQFFTWIRYAPLTGLLSYPYCHAILVGWNAKNGNAVRTRAVSAALYNMFVQAGNIAASNIYRDDDRPLYRRGNKILLGICCFNIVLFYLVKAFYIWRNKVRDRRWNAMTKDQQEDYTLNTTDEGQGWNNTFWATHDEHSSWDKSAPDLVGRQPGIVPSPATTLPGFWRRKTSPPFPGVADFWRTAVGRGDVGFPSNAEIIEWHEWARSNRTGLAGDVSRARPCLPEVCRSVGSKVDGGLAGFGLLASYGFEVIMLTVYCLFAVWRSFSRRKPADNTSEKPDAPAPDDKLGLSARVGEVLRCTTYDFFTAAAFLSLGIQSALIVSAAAFYPLAAMLPLILASARRGWLKGAVLVALFVIHTAAWVLCMNSTQAAVEAAMFTMAATVWMPPLFGLCLSVALCFYRCNNRKMWQVKWLNKVAGWAMVLYAAANFICMWGAWIVLVVFFNSTPPRAEDVWSLGQALALTPWIPVILEFASVLFLGAEAGFAGRLPLEFRVVRQEKALRQQEDAAFLDDARV